MGDQLVSQGFRIGVDIGGTFTDFVLLDGNRVVGGGKTLTTHGDPSVAVAEGVRRLLDDSGYDHVREVVHATTLVPNTLIERTGAIVALLTTRGFRDTLAIRREHRYDLYDLFLELPKPLVPRRLRWELDERMLADGTIDIPLDVRQIRRVAARARKVGIEAIAVCLLHSYRNPVHEQLVGQVFHEELPGLPVSLSCEVVPELGEYVRASTTVANAYVQPLVERYLALLESRLRDLGILAPVHVMLSTGGLSDVETTRRFPIRLAESGPAAGAISAAFTARSLGIADALAFDMGGTTAKACLIEDGVPLIAREHEVARVYRFARESGLPIRLPVVDLIEIGAGGGSIARRSQLGLPVVGPESSGSEPGPACYGRGGTQPTVTDADLLLGYLDPGFFLGGELQLDVEATRAAIDGFARSVGLGRIEAAAGIHRVVNEKMAAAARMHAIERGRDLRKFAMVATGGAGPIHAWGVARALGIGTVVMPPAAGVASAFGMLTVPPAFDFIQSLPTPLSQADWNVVRTTVDHMREQGARHVLGLGVGPELLQLELAADIRHLGQGETLTVNLGSRLEEEPERQVEAAFDAAYKQMYGRRPPGVEAEILSWRLRVAGPLPTVWRTATSEAGDYVKTKRQMWSEDSGAFVEATVIDRYRLRPGDTLIGPAIVEERESTAVIGVGGNGTLDADGNLIVTVDWHG